MDNKERNRRIIKLYTDNNKDIDTVVKIVESIPELKTSFGKKDIRKSCIGILNTVKGLWVKLEKKKAEPKDKTITKKEIVVLLLKALELEVKDFKTIQNMNKGELANIALSANEFSGNLDDDEVTELEKCVE